MATAAVNGDDDKDDIRVVFYFDQIKVRTDLQVI